MRTTETTNGRKAATTGRKAKEVFMTTASILRAELAQYRAATEAAYLTWKREQTPEAREAFKAAELAETNRVVQIGPLGNYS